MKIKTQELTGPALDWAVARCENYLPSMLNTKTGIVYGLVGELNFSTKWAQGGPIIERECICLTHPKHDCWTAIGQDGTDLDTPLYQEDGPTPLIAAMRCFVASKLGDEVDIPKELTP
jgi:hypothetical protein